MLWKRERSGTKSPMTAAIASYRGGRERARLELRMRDGWRRFDLGGRAEMRQRPAEVGRRGTRKRILKRATN